MCLSLGFDVFKTSFLYIHINTWSCRLRYTIVLYGQDRVLNRIRRAQHKDKVVFCLFFDSSSFISTRKFNSSGFRYRIPSPSSCILQSVIPTALASAANTPINFFLLLSTKFPKHHHSSFPSSPSTYLDKLLRTNPLCCLFKGRLWKGRVRNHALQMTDHFHAL